MPNDENGTNTNTSMEEIESAERNVDNNSVEVSPSTTTDNQEATTQLTENTSTNNSASSENEFYPSAVLMLDSCIQDYQRLQENYNKVYEKTNIALAFVGIVLTIMFTSLDFSSASLNASNMKIWEVIISSTEIICQFSSIILMIVSIILLLIVLKGKRIPVFKSEDIRNEEIYRLKESHAAVWLIDKYTQIANDIRPIVSKKQKLFDSALVLVIIGIIAYAISTILQKGGF